MQATDAVCGHSSTSVEQYDNQDDENGNQQQADLILFSPNQNAAGTSMEARAASCLKAFSFFRASRKPAAELKQP